MHRPIILLLVLVWVLGIAQPATAHGDQRLVDNVVSLDAGESAAFEGEVHYHRLVGRFTAGGPVAVRLINAVTGEVVVERTAASTVVVNALIACCDGRAWAPHMLVIENRAGVTLTVDATATLVHDDLAVMAHRAEAGTTESVVVLGLLWAWILVRIGRRGLATSPVRVWRPMAILFGAILAVGLYGAARYGSGSAPGLVAGLADVPAVPFNPIVSRASLSMGLAMLAWGVVGARWARGVSTMAWPAWSAAGVLLGGAVVVTALAVAGAYGLPGMPAAMAVAAIGPMAAYAAVVGRRARRSPAGPVGARTAMPPS